jgi:hypothetical protein
MKKPITVNRARKRGFSIAIARKIARIGNIDIVTIGTKSYAIWLRKAIDQKTLSSGLGMKHPNSILHSWPWPETLFETIVRISEPNRRIRSFHYFIGTVKLITRVTSC